MNIRTMRKSLLFHPDSLTPSTLRNVDTDNLCDESLKAYFAVCMNKELFEDALRAGLRIDKITLPRRGNMIDESGGFLTLRSGRIANARLF